MIVEPDTNEELAYLQAEGAVAAAALFDRNRLKLARMVMLRMDSRVVGKVDVDDVLQDAYVEASRRLGDYLDRPTVPFFVWLRQIASQKLIDTHRRYLGAHKRNVTQERSLSEWPTASASAACLAAHLADSLTTPSQCAARNEAVDQLKISLERLGENDREVLVLRHLEELSNNEVAEILGIDKYAASKRYLRALERLRSAMCVA